MPSYVLSTTPNLHAWRPGHYIISISLRFNFYMRGQDKEQ